MLFTLPCGPVTETSSPAQGLDIGPDSLKTFQGALADAKTVIWNGPMGVFEFDAFAKGTYGVAETLAELTPKVAPADLFAMPLHAVLFSVIWCAMASQSTVDVVVNMEELLPGGAPAFADCGPAARQGTITIIGGGDSVAAVEKAGLAEKMSHISTGGGASLELLEGKVGTLPEGT